MQLLLIVPIVRIPISAIMTTLIKSTIKYPITDSPFLMVSNFVSIIYLKYPITLKLSYSNCCIYFYVYSSLAKNLDIIVNN